MISTPPQLHAALASLAAVAAVLTGGLILAKNPGPTARLHFIYALVVAWWCASTALIATAVGDSAIVFWSRLAQISLGLLPGVVYHLNIALAGLADAYGARIRVHWVLSGALVLFGLFWPPLLGDPLVYAWGPTLSYSAWGLVFVVAVVVSLAESLAAYRVALASTDPRMVRHRKARVFFYGNVLASTALVSFLASFGFDVYPFGYLVLTVTHTFTFYGTLRYQLIELTPECAAEQVLNEMPDGVLVTDPDGIIRVLNGPAAESLGCEVSDALGRRPESVSRAHDLTALLQSTDECQPPRELVVMNEDGADRHVRLSSSIIADAADFPVARLWVMRDITSEKAAEMEKDRFEERVRDVQKLESLGVMAAGVAHDFNNLLMAIMGNAELARMAAKDGAAVEAHLRKIEATADRASELTGQMLTYTGHGPTHQRPINLNHVVSDVSELISAAISKKATVTLELQPDLPLVSGDPSQLSQVILNLVTNASEALEETSGAITLRSGTCRPDPSYHRWFDAPDAVEVGPHVFVEAEDTGVGMDDKVRQRIFDPFFTTKFTGRGLGLATLVGIVRTHSGYTRVESAPGRGTTFRVAMPVANPAPFDDQERATPDRESWGSLGVALLADDEPEVRQVVHSMLVRDGFRVIEAVNGQEAVDMFEARADEVSLVVLDHAMPELNGREAFERIRATFPDVPVVFMSGYTDSVVEPLDCHTTFLHKPFRAEVLTARIREAMKPTAESR